MQSVDLLRQRLMGGGWPQVVDTALALSLASTLAWCCDQKQLLAGIPSRVGSDGSETAPALLARVWNEHLEQRQKMLERLEELVTTLNARGIVPVLLKGARSLWVASRNGAPCGTWTCWSPVPVPIMRRPLPSLPAIGRAKATWRTRGTSITRRTSIATTCPAGWKSTISPEARAARSSCLPPNWSNSPCRWSGRRVRAGPPPGYDLLHGMVHRHAGHREARNGGLELKGLFEFALVFAGLSADERDWLAARTGKDSRLLAMVDLWVAASAERFALKPGARFKIEPDAMGRWRKLRDGTKRPSKREAIANELALALRPRGFDALRAASAGPVASPCACILQAGSSRTGGRAFTERNGFGTIAEIVGRNGGRLPQRSCCRFAVAELEMAAATSSCAASPKIRVSCAANLSVPPSGPRSIRCCKMESALLWPIGFDQKLRPGKLQGSSIRIEAQTLLDGGHAVLPQLLQSFSLGDRERSTDRPLTPC